MNEWAFKALRCRVIERLRECPENAEIAGPFQAKQPSCFLGLIILIPANVRQRFHDLASAVVHRVRLTDKSNDLASTGRFIEYHFGVASRDYLRALLFGNLGQKLIRLALAK